MYVESGCDFFSFALLKSVLFEKNEIRGNMDPEEKVAQKMLSDAQKLISGYPIQYYLGVWEFYERDFLCREGVLIPRPCTETVVKEAQKNLESGDYFCDFCCGSGCIGITLLKNVPDTFCDFYDVSETALSLTRDNAERHLCAERSRVQYGNVLERIEIQKKPKLIVCNPPYIKTDDILKLDKNVQNEPHLALDGGEDGLLFYKTLLTIYKQYIENGGIFVFELGDGEFEEFEKLCKDKGFSVVFANDENGLVRCATVRIQK